MNANDTGVASSAAQKTPQDAGVGGRAPASLTPAARRALEEAEARRKAATPNQAATEEIGGRGGLDPARYGDWEVKGLTSDF